MPSFKVGVACAELVLTRLVLDDDSLDLSDPILVNVTLLLPILLTPLLLIIVVAIMCFSSSLALGVLSLKANC